MEWDQVRNRWQQQPVAAVPAMTIHALRERDKRLARAVVWRDVLETLAAIAVVGFLSVYTINALGNEYWWRALAAGGLVAWAVFVPLRLRQARRRAAPPLPSLSLAEHLNRRRDAALAQAHMLETAWLWYVAPCVIGVTALSLTVAGPTVEVMIYLAVVLAFGVVLALLNWHTGRTRFRAHAEQLQAQLDALAGDTPG